MPRLFIAGLALLVLLVQHETLQSLCEESDATADSYSSHSVYIEYDGNYGANKGASDTKGGGIGYGGDTGEGRVIGVASGGHTIVTGNEGHAIGLATQGHKIGIANDGHTIVADSVEKQTIVTESENQTIVTEKEIKYHVEYTHIEVSKKNEQINVNEHGNKNEQKHLNEHGKEESERIKKQIEHPRANSYKFEDVKLPLVEKIDHAKDVVIAADVGLAKEDEHETQDGHVTQISYQVKDERTGLPYNTAQVTKFGLAADGGKEEDKIGIPSNSDHEEKSNEFDFVEHGFFENEYQSDSEEYSQSGDQDYSAENMCSAEGGMCSGEHTDEHSESDEIAEDYWTREDDNYSQFDADEQQYYTPFDADAQDEILSTEQIERASNEQFERLSNEKIEKLSNEQVEVLSKEQIKKVSDENIDRESMEQDFLDETNDEWNVANFMEAHEDAHFRDYECVDSNECDFFPDFVKEGELNSVEPEQLVGRLVARTHHVETTGVNLTAVLKALVNCEPQTVPVALRTVELHNKWPSRCAYSQQLPCVGDGGEHALLHVHKKKYVMALFIEPRCKHCLGPLAQFYDLAEIYSFLYNLQNLHSACSIDPSFFHATSDTSPAHPTHNAGVQKLKLCYLQHYPRGKFLFKQAEGVLGMEYFKSVVFLAALLPEVRFVKVNCGSSTYDQNICAKTLNVKKFPVYHLYDSSLYHLIHQYSFHSSEARPMLRWIISSTTQLFLPISTLEEVAMYEEAGRDIVALLPLPFTSKETPKIRQLAYEHLSSSSQFDETCSIICGDKSEGDNKHTNTYKNRDQNTQDYNCVRMCQQMPSEFVCAALYYNCEITFLLLLPQNEEDFIGFYNYLRDDSMPTLEEGQNVEDALHVGEFPLVKVFSRRNAASSVLAFNNWDAHLHRNFCAQSEGLLGTQAFGSCEFYSSALIRYVNEHRYARVSEVTSENFVEMRTSGRFLVLLAMRNSRSDYFSLLKEFHNVQHRWRARLPNEEDKDFEERRNTHVFGVIDKEEYAASLLKYNVFDTNEVKILVFHVLPGVYFADDDNWLRFSEGALSLNKLFDSLLFLHHTLQHTPTDHIDTHTPLDNGIIARIEAQSTLEAYVISPLLNAIHYIYFMASQRTMDFLTYAGLTLLLILSTAITLGILHRICFGDPHAKVDKIRKKGTNVDTNVGTGMGSTIGTTITTTIGNTTDTNTVGTNTVGTNTGGIGVGNAVKSVGVAMGNAAESVGAAVGNAAESVGAVATSTAKSVGAAVGNAAGSTTTTGKSVTTDTKFSPTPSRTISPTPPRTISPTPSRTISPTPSRTVTPTPSRTVSPTPSKIVSPSALTVSGILPGSSSHYECLSTEQVSMLSEGSEGTRTIVRSVEKTVVTNVERRQTVKSVADEDKKSAKTRRSASRSRKKID